jgi:hypothetical protein
MRQHNICVETETLKWDRKGHCFMHELYYYIQGVSGGIVNILGGGSMDYSE